MNPPRYVQSAPPPFVIDASMYAGDDHGPILGSYVLIVDADGRTQRVTLPVPSPGRSYMKADMVLPPGARWANDLDADAYRRRRDDAGNAARRGGWPHRRPEPLACYQLAAVIAARDPFVLTVADLEDLHAAVAGRRTPQIRPGSVRPMRTIAGPDKPPVVVADEVRRMLDYTADTFAARRVIEAAAFIAHRATWLHIWSADGCGRASRAAMLAVLYAGIPELRASHAKRIGAIGRDHLVVAERLEGYRYAPDGYITLMNQAHDDAERCEVYPRAVDLSRFESLLSEFVDDQIAGRPSREDA